MATKLKPNISKEWLGTVKRQVNQLERREKAKRAKSSVPRN